MPAYLRALHKANPPVGLNNSQLVTDYQSGTNDSFGRLYIQPGCIESTFIESLPMILLDATFFLNVYNQSILLAIGRDGNNRSYLIAWAIVESENTDSWTWFIRNLIRGCPAINETTTPFQKPIRTTTMSDRDKGLLNAMKEIIPNVHHAHCCWHLAENIKKHFGIKARDAFWKLVYVQSTSQWDTALAKFQEVGHQAAVDYILKIDRASWCRMSYPGPRFGWVATGSLESLNSVLLIEHQMNVIQLLDALWTRCQEQRVLCAEEAREWVPKTDSNGNRNLNYYQWTPWAEARIKERHNWANKLTVVEFVQRYIDEVLLLHSNIEESLTVHRNIIYCGLKLKLKVLNFLSHEANRKFRLKIGIGILNGRRPISLQYMNRHVHVGYIRITLYLVVMLLQLCISVKSVCRALSA